MRVLLIHPPPLGKDSFQYDIVHPPLGIAYIASCIRKEHDVKIIDANALRLNLNDLKKEVKDYRPDVVGLTSTTAAIFNTFKVARMVKRIDSRIRVFLGGVHATASPRHAMSEKSIDFLCIGEGEITSKELLSSIASGEPPLSAIKGIAWRDGRKVVVNEPRGLLPDLDSLPMPAYDLLPMDRYTSIQASEGRIMTLVTSRGCPYECIFCDVQAVFGRRFRFHSPERVLEEIEYLMRNYGITEFHFKDSEFTLDPKRVQKICDLIVRKRLNIRWLCNGRVNHMSLELLKSMKKAGCKMITFGVESGDDRILQVLKKAYTTDDVRKAFRLAKQAGIETTANMIIGCPGDTKETIERTIRFAIEIDPNYASFNNLIPFPNTELFRMAKRNRWLLPNYRLDRIKYDSCIMNATDIPLKELNSYLGKAYRRFYIRPRYIIKRLGKLRWHEIKTTISGVKKIVGEFI